MHVKVYLILELLSQDESWFLRGNFYLSLQFRIYFEFSIYQQVLHNTLWTLIWLHKARIYQIRVFGSQFSVVTIIVKTNHYLILNRGQYGVFILDFGL